MADATSPDPEVIINDKHDQVGQGDTMNTEGRDFDDDYLLGRPDVDDDSDTGHRHTRGGDQFMPRYIPAQPGLSVLLKPEPYYGKESWEEYFSHFQDCSELGQWDDRTKLLFLAASLRGQARTFYMSLIPEERRIFATLVQRMDQRFGCSKHKNRWLSKLEMRRRTPGETIAEVGDDIRQLAQKAYSNLDIDAQESLALNHLFKIIPVEMKCRCIDKECNTVTEAVDVIERYESIVGDGDKKRPIRSVGHDKNTRQSETELHDPAEQLGNTVQHLVERLDKLESAHKKSLNKRFNAPMTCFICDSPDHLMKECPDRRHRKQSNYDSRRMQRDRGSDSRDNQRYQGHSQQGNGRVPPQ